MRRERRALAGLVACVALLWGCYFVGDGQSGTPLAYEDCGDGTVVDGFTNLMWEQKVEGGDETTCLTALHGADSRCSWLEANQEWIDAVNAEGYAGYSDWRVPHAKELLSIVDYSERRPAIDPIFGPIGSRWRYWAATAHAIEPDWGWYVGFDRGGLGYLTSTDVLKEHVRAVRDGECP
jgi:hypothetical protein